jgi:hypothetical protein
VIDARQGQGAEASNWASDKGNRVRALPKSLPHFDEPLEMLEACHDTIEAQPAALENLVPHVAVHGADAAARKAAQGVMRYFDTAGQANRAAFRHVIAEVADVVGAK